MLRQLHFKGQEQRNGFQGSKTEERVQVNLPTGVIQNKAYGGALACSVVWVPFLRMTGDRV